MTEDMDIEDVILPELTDARIGEIEEALFAEIRRARTTEIHRAAAAERARRARRGRLWLGGGAAAAVIVVAALLAPAMPGLLGGSAGSAESAADRQPLPVPADGDDAGGDLSAPDAASEEGGTLSGASDREIIATASATVRVDDVAAAAERIGDRAESVGGYVEAMSIGGAEAMPYDTYEYDDAVSYPSLSGAWITVRVPAAELAGATAALADIGDVTASQIDRRDVTSEAVDLRARIDALGASVERLTALVSQAESTSDLIAAEEALAARQSDLESYQQHLKYLDEQVGMSTLTVTLFEPEPPVTADPAGFGDGLAAGWHGLLATLNGFVLALGFLLPWLAVIAVVGAIVWAVRRAVKRRKARATESADAGASLD